MQGVHHFGAFVTGIWKYKTIEFTKTKINLRCISEHIICRRF